MLSIIMPYWDRQEAANKALTMFAAQYADLDLEVIVVDDGNAVPFVIPDIKLNVRVIYLPKKDCAKTSCVPLNAGVRAATGDVIVLNCIEILHDRRVLPEMLAQLEAIGENGYVLPSVWCPDENKWHVHSQYQDKLPSPKGTALHFCGMMRKSLFLKAGGLDEDYRDGAGYDDNDFINRLLKVGAQFCIRDDLRVIHPKDGARSNWPDGSFERNKALFDAKWATPPKSLAVVCVEIGDYCGRGERYVRTMKAMVNKHLTLPHTFYCITDTPKKGITCIEAHERLPGWWQKIYQFKHGLFEEEKILYFDLDTFILGNIDKIASLDTDFAPIRDFWQPQITQSGVMLWRNGGMAHFFWDLYESQGFPQDHPSGDGGWIGDQVMPPMNFKLLQDCFPDQFVSYKTECMKIGKETLRGPPILARIMCFHGHPRPHEAIGWTRNFWNFHKPHEMNAYKPTEMQETKVA